MKCQNCCEHKNLVYCKDCDCVKCEDCGREFKKEIVYRDVVIEKTYPVYPVYPNYNPLPPAIWQYNC